MSEPYRETFSNLRRGKAGNWFGGLIYDSGFEANVARILDKKVVSGELLKVDRQHRVNLPVYDHTARHLYDIDFKVDFRLHWPDDSYTLLEAKGKEYPLYVFKKNLLTRVWIAENPDHNFEVLLQTRYHFLKNKLSKH